LKSPLDCGNLDAAGRSPSRNSRTGSRSSWEKDAAGLEQWKKAKDSQVLVVQAGLSQIIGNMYSSDKLYGFGQP